MRVPVGLLFIILGAVLALFGALSGAAIYERSLGIDVNLIWGIIMLVFGAAMLFFGVRHRGGA